MKTLIFIAAWCVLFMVCWPLAVFAVVVWPLAWLLSLPFRLLAVSCDAMLALFTAILFLPARLLGYRDRPVDRAS